MKAIVCTQYGSPDVIQLREVPKPAPKANQVLIKIRATTITTGDCEIRRFDIPTLFWLPLRIILGITKPKPGIFGQEFAGDVEATGTAVTKVKVGDTVFGPTTIRLGAHAQYICLTEFYVNRFVPDKMTYAEAATIPTGGLNGLHFVTKANIQPHEKVLINGAGGSIGTYALQIAKSRGAEVTSVDSSIKLEMLRNLGADHVIDYAKKDFTMNGERYDVIIDVVGKSSFSRSIKSLTANGRYVLGNPTLSGMLRGLWTSMRTNKKVIFQFADYKQENFTLLRHLIETGKLRPVIDKYYPLEQVADAHRYVEAGLKAGNVVIQISHQDK